MKAGVKMKGGVVENTWCKKYTALENPLNAFQKAIAAAAA